MSRSIYFYFLLTFCLIGCISHAAYAQQDAPSAADNSRRTDTIIAQDSNQLDVIDVIHILLHKEKDKARYEEKHETGKIHLSLLPGFGYTLQTGLAGIITGNIGYYTGSSAKQKISSIQFDFAYTQKHQFLIPLQANIWSKENKYNLILDWRYLKYPSLTYGLGGYTTVKDGYLVDFSYFKIHQSLFKNIGKNLYAGLGYYLDYAWNIKEINPVAPTSFENYGFTTTEQASGLAFRFLFDSRLNQINPHNGFYSNIVFRPNFKLMGSQSNWQSLLIEFRKYIRLPFGSNNILAFWNYNWLTVGGKPPYLFLPSNGWDDPYDNTGRGYIQGRFRGKNMIYLEAEYRFGITHNGLIGGVVFSNIQSFSKTPFQAFRTIQPAVGTGLRIKINKISGSNLCLDYGLGLHGSSGIFVNLTEIF